MVIILNIYTSEYAEVCSRTQEQELVAVLFEDYDPAVRPVCNASESVDINLALKISKVDELVT